MKVLHVITGLETGGAEGMLSRLIREMPTHIHLVVSLTNLGAVGKNLAASGYSVHALDIRPGTSLRAALQLWNIIRINKPDVIQTWMYHSDFIGGVIGRLAGVKNIIWNVRNTNIPQGIFSSTNFIIIICVALSKFIPRAIIYCSNAGLNHHVSKGYRNNRMLVIPNGFNVHPPQPSLSTQDLIRSELGVLESSFLVGIVGRFDPLKGYDIFIKAAGRIASTYSPHFVFIMVGRNVDESNYELNDLIKKHGGSAKFILMGEQNRISQLMTIFDIFCLSSLSEGFPNVVAEAMLAGTPCVVTDVGDAKLIVGSTGIVVPPNNPNAIAQAMIKLFIVGHAKRLEMGLAARKRIIDHFNISDIALQYENIYTSIAEI
jgi:glycosyltransferase involved in cell wall biosynthesis